MLSIVVLAIEFTAPAVIVVLPLIVKLAVVPAPPRLMVPPLSARSPYTFIVNVLPAPDMETVPPGANVRVTAVEEIVPRFQTADAGKVIAMFMVHVSPGVVKLVGEPTPSVQFPRLFTGPAMLVVHAVAKLLLHEKHNRIIIKNARTVLAVILLQNRLLEKK